ncbi:MAG: hypothetical protein HQL52_01480 [Magnetococcales bacterium]|nr:hypothetical protein [Magnetococcales bacterium]
MGLATLLGLWLGLPTALFSQEVAGMTAGTPAEATGIQPVKGVATPRAAPPFKLHGQPAKADCVNCHGWRPANPTPRHLNKPHQALWGHGAPANKHGGGRFWCYHCHDTEEPDILKLPAGARFAFEEGHRTCALCHPAQVRDWQFGAHGKRVGNWQGPRTIQRCFSCHNPHHPAWKRPPDPPLTKAAQSDHGR